MARLFAFFSFFLVLRMLACQALLAESLIKKYGRVEMVDFSNNYARIRIADQGLVKRLKGPAIENYFKQKSLFIFNANSVAVAKFKPASVQVGDGRHIIISGYYESEKDNTQVRAGMDAGVYDSKPVYRPPVRYQLPPREPLPSIYHEVDGKEMLFVGADYVIYGQDYDPQLSNYNPEFKTRTADKLDRIQAFYIDKYEVTNHEFWTFCRKTGYRMPQAWAANQGKYPMGADKIPFLMTFAEAKLYASWSGKNIPDEIQWEMAARGGLSLLAVRGQQEFFASPPLYAGSNRFDPEICNTLESSAQKLLPVDRLRDRSPYGVMGMCGNAAEWTSSWFGPYKGHRFSENSLSGKQVLVIRGGSYDRKKEAARADSRLPGGIPDLYSDRSAGLRLIKPVP